MPYHAEWYRLYQVMEARVWGHVTVEEIELHADMCVQFLQEAQMHAPENRVNLLFDALEAESIPPIYMMFTQGLRVLKFKNRDTMFLITRNARIRSVIEVTAHISRQHFPLRVFEDRQAALDALESRLSKEVLRAGETIER